MDIKSAYKTLTKSISAKLDDTSTTKHDLTTCIINRRNNHKKISSQQHTPKIEADNNLEINIKNILSILQKGKTHYENEKDSQEIIDNISNKINIILNIKNTKASISPLNLKTAPNTSNKLSNYHYNRAHNYQQKPKLDTTTVYNYEQQFN